MQSAHNFKSTIRCASISDLPRLMRYVDAEWKARHIFARDAAFFKYEYQNGDALNFIISENPSGDIDGMLGFIPASAETHCDVWTTMWKVSRGSGNPILGLQLLQYLKAQGHTNMMSLGINKKTIAIYRYLGFSTGTLQHHYLRNRRVQNFRIARLPSESDSVLPDFQRREGVRLRTVVWADVLTHFPATLLATIQPVKDLGYIRRRYFEHPLYAYRMYGVFDQDAMVALLVARVVTVGEASALRLVDILGDISYLPRVAHALHGVLESECMEYLDLVSYGIDGGLLKQAGFIPLDLTSEEVVIPNYFQPFTQKNVTINFFVDGEIPVNLRIFKADGDQDRPS